MYTIIDFQYLKRLEEIAKIAKSNEKPIVKAKLPTTQQIKIKDINTIIENLN